MGNVIEVETLSRDVGGHRILGGVSFKVEAGEALAVVGPSGSGKTTLLRLVAGLDVPSGGSIQLDGRTISVQGHCIPPHQRGMGMVFQRCALWPHMTVAQNVAFGLAAMARSEVRARVGELLEMTSLLGLEGRRPHQLSGGEAQRVAIARAIAPRPSILLLDEPLSGLDPELHAEMKCLLRQVRTATGATVMYVSHDHGEVAAMTDRVLVMRRGQSAYLGGWEEARSLEHAW